MAQGETKDYAKSPGCMCGIARIHLRNRQGTSAAPFSMLPHGVLHFLCSPSAKCSHNDTHATVAASKRCDASRIGNCNRRVAVVVSIFPHANDVQRRMCHVCIAVCYYQLVDSFLLVIQD